MKHLISIAYLMFLMNASAFAATKVAKFSCLERDCSGDYAAFLQARPNIKVIAVTPLNGNPTPGSSLTYHSRTEFATQALVVTYED